MLLLLTIGLVIVGAIALVFGFASGDQLPIFISIACSLLAGGVLVLFSRMSRRATPAVSSASGPSALTDESVAEAVNDDQPTRVVPASAAAAPSGDFPIEGYESLTVAQILPKLDSLDLDQLDLVAEREEAGKSRATILKRIDLLADALEGVAPEPAAAVVAAAPATAAAAAPSASAAADGFPVAGYDELTVAEILPLLDGLSDDELDEVAEREETGPNRATVLDRIDAIFDERDAAAESTSAPVKKVAAKATAAKKTATKTVAKKAPAKAAVKTSAKKAVAAKAPAKKTATKTVAKKSPAKAPAKKATPSKSTAKKAPAKKAAARTATKAPAKKATAKKATAKKAAKKR